MGNRTPNPPVCDAVPQPTEPLRAPMTCTYWCSFIDVLYNNALGISDQLYSVFIYVRLQLKYK
jgi:hypothetical protein